jgi:hypothetical protein
MMPNGYIKVKEGKTQSAERILPLTPRGRETLLILRTEPRRKNVENDLEGFNSLVRALPVELGPVRWKAEVI